ncbi:pyridoxal phosphate-dependent transferase [Lactarius deliciosus]|nr:pyridoxal phosphate-dependent transferase [Lactarius deliciosus]
MISSGPFSYFLPCPAPSSPHPASPAALHESRLVGASSDSQKQQNFASGPLTPEKQKSDLASVPGLWCKWRAETRQHWQASPQVEVRYPLPYNSTGLADNETIKVHAIETLRKYGVDSCGPPKFYGTIARRSGFPLYRVLDSLLSEFSKIPSVISAFAKRSDIIVADRGISFCCSEGLANLVFYGSLIELKHKYKYRLILDESISFGTVERTGRGRTEVYNVPTTKIDMIVGSVANGINSSGGFCAGSRIVVDHQCINGTSSVFSAAVPALPVASASEVINILWNTPSILTITIPSHTASPIIHIHLRSFAPSASVSAKPSNPATPAPREAPSFDIVGEERLLQDIVDEALAQGVWMARARRLRGQELVEARQSTRLAVTAGLSRCRCH